MEWKKKKTSEDFPTVPLLGGVMGSQAGLKPEWLWKASPVCTTSSEEISSLLAQKQVALKGAIPSTTAAKYAPSLEVSGF